MDKELKKLINDMTQDIIDDYEISIPITNIEEVVHKLGGSIRESSSVDFLADGSVRRDGDKFLIIISPFQSEERKKFTIAHELGHLFLHMGYRINDELWDGTEDSTYYCSEESLLEYQANEFAAALLMPEKKYKEIMDKNKNVKENIVYTNKIAEYFRVSVSAASSRGKFLGYLK